MHQELVKVRMWIGIVCDFEQRHENVVKNLIEILYELIGFENIALN